MAQPDDVTNAVPLTPAPVTPAPVTRKGPAPSQPTDLSPSIQPTQPSAPTKGPNTPGFLPTQPNRRGAESVLVRVIATAGVIGIGTAVGAILGANDVDAWILALVVSAVSVVLAAVLWRSRRL